MFEIYFLLMLDNLTGLFLWLGIISTITGIVFLSLSIINSTMYNGQLTLKGKGTNYWGKGFDKVSSLIYYKSMRLYFKRMKKMFSLGLLFISLHLFIPDTKQSLMIFGIGGTIDYVRSNEKLQGIPDKCVDAVDMFFEMLTYKNDSIK